MDEQKITKVQVTMKAEALHLVWVDVLCHDCELHCCYTRNGEKLGSLVTVSIIPNPNASEPSEERIEEVLDFLNQPLRLVNLPKATKD